MRLVSHPNVVNLRAFFYSNEEKVRFSLGRSLADPDVPDTERRSIPQSCTRIRPRDRISSFSSLCEVEAAYADVADQTIHVPTIAIIGLYSFSRHMPSRYQAPESVTQPSNWGAEAL